MRNSVCGCFCFFFEACLNLVLQLSNKLVQFRSEDLEVANIEHSGSLLIIMNLASYKNIMDPLDPMIG